MLTSRLISDVGRVCVMGLPLPMVCGALGPLMRESFGSAFSAFTLLYPTGEIACLPLGEGVLSPESVDLLSDPATLLQLDQESGIGTRDFLASGRPVQLTGEVNTFIRSSLYERHFETMGLHHGMRVPLYLNQRPLGYAWLARPPNDRPFSQREVQGLVKLAPWFSHALALSNNSVTPGKIDALAGQGIIILDTKGRVVWRCAMGARFLHMLEFPDGKLAGPGRAALDRLLIELARQCRNLLTGYPATPPRWRGCTAWGTFFMDAALLESDPAGTQPMVAVTIRRHVPQSLKVAAALLGNTTLTSRQKDICLAMAQGLSRPEIAVKLRIGISTVVTHIAALYDRLGAENREDMLRIVVSEPPLATGQRITAE